MFCVFVSETSVCEQKDVTSYNCEYTITPKPKISDEFFRLPYFDFLNTKSVSISVDSSSTSVIFKTYEITNASEQNGWEVISNQILEQTINTPYTYELQLKDKTNYLIISETPDNKETRLYFTTYPEI